MKKERNSEYLLNKCKNLQNSLTYFTLGDSKTRAEIRRIIFLAQIDFWDWEIEELIFSFQNWKIRSKAWEGCTAEIFKMLKDNNISLKLNEMSSIDYWVKNRYYDINSKYNEVEVVIPPKEELLKTINIYNNLLILCEKEINETLDKYKKLERV